MTIATDEALLTAWRAGDEEAGNALLTRHFESLYRFVAAKLDADVEDLVQQAFLTCLEHPPGAWASSFRAYLFGVARNLLKQHWRKRERHDRAVDRMLTAEQMFGSGTAALALQDECGRLQQALRRIPLDLQILLELHYWEELSLEEVAHVIEVPIGTVKSRLHRARTLLRHALQHEPSLPTGSQSGFETWARRVRRAFGRSTPQTT